MGTVLIQHGEPGPDGTPPPRAYFQLIEGKLHMPTIRDYFRLANVMLDGIVFPTDNDGFTFSCFLPNTHVRVTGDPLPGGPNLTRILLMRINEVYGEVEQPGGKRRVTQVEENMGLWTLPPPEVQPRTLAELSAALRCFLQIDHNITWLFKYRYQNELLPIVSDAALSVTFDYFRAQAAQAADDEPGAHQQCRLYLNTISEEMAPRDIIRARITGILDAAAAGRESSGGMAPNLASAAPSIPECLMSGTENAALALPGGQHQQLALAAASFGPYGLAMQQTYELDGGMQTGFGGDFDGDDGEDGETQGEGGMMNSLVVYSRQSGSEGASGPGGVLKKESKTRHSDGRFKNEVQHMKKMADMTRKIVELFDGQIMHMVEVIDHKKILCLLCNHTCTAYSAYHTDCVRKHFLRHHESTLRERGVDIARWRKEYEVSQKVKRQQQQHQMQYDQTAAGNFTVGHGMVHPSMQALTVRNLLAAAANAGAAGSQSSLQHLGLPGLLFNGLSAALQQANASAAGFVGGGSGGGDADAAQRSLHAQLMSFASIPSEALTQQSAGAGLGSAPAGGFGSTPSVSSLLLQAQAVSQDEQLQVQTAGALSACEANMNGGGVSCTSGSLVHQLRGALGGGHSNSTSSSPHLAALATMARMASGTVVTEMPLPPQPLSSPAAGQEQQAASPQQSMQLALQVKAESTNSQLFHEVGHMDLPQSGCAASPGQVPAPGLQ